MNCSVRPLATEGLVGPKAIEVERRGGDRQGVVRAGDPVKLAVIAVIPTARVEARPWLPAAFEMVATEGVAEVQVTWLVRFGRRAVGVGPRGGELLVRPLATDGFTGASAIEVSAAAVTVSVSLGLVIPLRVAVIAVVPTARVEARPWLPDALEMVATDGVADAQVTWLVRSAFEPSV